MIPFDGVRAVGTKDYKLGAADIVNFRFLPDGSLQKRSGYQKLATMPKLIRAIWSGTISGIPLIFVLAGADVYSISYLDNEMSKIATIGNSGKPASFFFYRRSLFLIDGNNIYAVSSDAVRPAVGYAPLIGKNWHDEEIGEINEPRNALTNRARISYLITKSTASMLYADGPIASIEALYVNGELISSENYMISSNPSIVIVSGLKQNDRVELYFTYATEISDSAIKANTRATVFGGISNSRPFLYGAGNGAVMYSGAYVSDSDLEDCRRVYSDSDSIYFPLNHKFTVGDGRYPIKGVARHFDRLLIFTEGGVWMADSSACATEDFPIMNINTTVSIVTQGTAVMGNTPCTVGADGVYAYASNTDELDECNAYPISDAIDSLLAPEWLLSSKLHYWQAKDELLLYSGEGDVVWVYSPKRSVWTRYTGICAYVFFDVDGNAAFHNGKNIFVFYDDLVTDEGSQIIQGKIVSHPEDFSTPKKKRLSYVATEVSDGEITVDLHSDDESILRGELTFGTDGSNSVLQKKRARANRFQRVSASIFADGKARQRIVSASLAVK
ncbi:MAG: hypothetical protein E7677_04605 [Ruminococcaceae bacterium]|nr:hypothetical protein [Oscillospiraceae bacterium]